MQETTINGYETKHDALTAATFAMSHGTQTDYDRAMDAYEEFMRREERRRGVR